MAVKTLTIDGKLVSAREDDTLLDAAREAGIHIPTLCHLNGLSEAGACRLCLVEVGGSGRLQPACVTRVREGLEVQTDTERLREYRRMIVELWTRLPEMPQPPREPIDRIAGGIRPLTATLAAAWGAICRSLPAAEAQSPETEPQAHLPEIGLVGLS